MILFFYGTYTVFIPPIDMGYRRRYSSIKIVAGGSLRMLIIMGLTLFLTGIGILAGWLTENMRPESMNMAPFAGTIFFLLGAFVLFAVIWHKICEKRSRR